MNLSDVHGHQRHGVVAEDGPSSFELFKVKTHATFNPSNHENAADTPEAILDAKVLSAPVFEMKRLST